MKKVTFHIIGLLLFFAIGRAHGQHGPEVTWFEQLTPQIVRRFAVPYETLTVRLTDRYGDAGDVKVYCFADIYTVSQLNHVLASMQAAVMSLGPYETDGRFRSLRTSPLDRALGGLVAWVKDMPDGVCLMLFVCESLFPAGRYWVDPRMGWTDYLIVLYKDTDGEVWANYCAYVGDGA